VILEAWEGAVCEVGTARDRVARRVALTLRRQERDIEIAASSAVEHIALRG
jgi:hypothetical protein